MIESSGEYIDVCVRDVEKAILKLRSRKSDGSEGLESDHIIKGTDTLNSILTVLICLIHFSIAHLQFPLALHIQQIILCIIES